MFVLSTEPFLSDFRELKNKFFKHPICNFRVIITSIVTIIHRLTSALSTTGHMLSEKVRQSLIYEKIKVSYITNENVMNCEKGTHKIKIYSVLYNDFQLYS